MKVRVLKRQCGFKTLDFFDCKMKIGKNDIRGVIFDLDGTLYLGERALPGAVDVCRILKDQGVGIVFVSNKPLEDRRVYAAKLNRLGIAAEPDQVITSAAVLGAYLAAEAPGLRCYVIGEDNLKQELRQFGLQVVEENPEQDEREVLDAAEIDAVIVAFDRTLNYRKLNLAYQALLRGALFFATNNDRACPMPGGSIPDAGMTIAALEVGTGRKLEFSAGKPSPLILQTVLDRLGLTAPECLMVGDRLETDMRMGREAGMVTALVLTGVTRRSDLDSCLDLPDLVLDNLFSLFEKF